MADLSITNTFVANTKAKAAEVNTNFTDVESYINARNDGTTEWDNLKVTASADAATEVPRFDQLKILQVVSATTTTNTSTTSTSFVSTNASVTITPTSASSTILVFANGTLTHDNTGFSGVATLARDTTNLMAANGGAETQVASAGSSTMSASLFWEDSPATTSPTTYRVRIKTVSGGGTTGWLFNNATQGTMLAMEVNGL